MTGTLHEDICTFTEISRCIMLRMKNFSGKILDKIRKKILLNFFFLTILRFMS